MDKESKPTVSVVMITYMHENFISEAIEGVLMQEVDFDIELIIADDCSPDGTQGIVKHYIDNHPKGCWIKYIRHNQNIGMMPNFLFALKEAKGKYIALCDGDDYWTDAKKTQNQVQIINNNTDCQIVFTNCYMLYENCNGKKPEPMLNYKNDFKFDVNSYLNQDYYTVTPTVLFKNFIFNELDKKNFVKSLLGDEYLFSFLLKNGKSAYYSKEITANYRLHHNGANSLRPKIKQLFYKLKTLDLLKKEFKNDINELETINKVISENIDRLFNYSFDGLHELNKKQLILFLIKYQPSILLDYRFYYNWYIKKLIGK